MALVTLSLVSHVICRRQRSTYLLLTQETSLMFAELEQSLTSSFLCVWCTWRGAGLFVYMTVSLWQSIFVAFFVYFNSTFR